MLVSAVKFCNLFLPSTLAIKATTRFIGRSDKKSPTARDLDALAKGNRFTFGTDYKRVAWSWGKGPIVIFVHGWGGRAAQMAAMAKKVADAGFRSIIFDATAHGESAGKIIGFKYFISDINQLTQQLNQDIYGVVGHSAGGLSTMAAREIIGLKAKKYVSLCAPCAPYPPINSIQKLIGPSSKLLSCYKNYYANQFNSTWKKLDAALAFAVRDDEKLMLVYDLNDKIVDPRDGKKIQKRWPSVKLIETKNLGHQKVLWSPTVIEEVASFISQ